MKIKDKVLIVEDEQSISNFISMILTANGFDTIIVRTGEEALTMIASHCPDMIVLDLGLPDMDGMEVLKSVRKWSNLPVVVVSARNHEHDKVEALDYGADDYLVKPFGMMELLARVRAVLRRSAPSGADGGFQIGSLYVSPPRHIVRVDDRDVQLTNKEFELLCLLVENRGIVLTRGTLMDKVWGFDCDRENRTLDVHIRTLRVKLGEAGSCIETVRGVGYKIGSGV